MKIEDFWNFYSEDTETGCMNWTRSKNKGGYGNLKINGKVEIASRIAYILSYGKIPDGLFVLHKCDNRCCVNPAHLFLGTQKDNVDDMTEKGRDIKSNNENHHWCKLKNEDVESIRMFPKFYGYKKILTKRFNISSSQIEKIRKGKSRTISQ